MKRKFIPKQIIPAIGWMAKFTSENRHLVAWAIGTEKVEGHGEADYQLHGLVADGKAIVSAELIEGFTGYQLC